MKCKKIQKNTLALVAAGCIFLTACGTEYAQNEYDSNEKIVSEADRYSKKCSVLNNIGGTCTLSVSEYDGRQTLWTDDADEDYEAVLDLSLSLSKGQVKVVYVDDNDNITNIIECKPEDSTDGYITKTLSMKKGKNKIKIVGYDCRDLELKFSFRNEE